MTPRPRGVFISWRLLGALVAVGLVAAGIVASSGPSEPTKVETASNGGYGSELSDLPGPDTAEETSTTTGAATTATTAAPTTTMRQLTVEERLAVLEAATTTTTAPRPVPPTAIFSREESRNGAWTLVFLAYNHAQFAAHYPNAQIRFRLQGVDGEVTVPVPVGPNSRTVEVTYVVEGATGPVFQELVAVDWDGGTLPGGSCNSALPMCGAPA